MNENPFASPAETVETLAGEAPPWEELPPKMAWVKWGMVWIFGSMAGLWGGIFLPYHANWVFDALFGIHTVGMIFCCLCPDSVVSRRGRQLGWISVLLFGACLLGVTRSLPVWGSWWWNDWPWLAQGAGIWLWLVFVLMLAYGIRSRRCQGLAWVVLVCDTFIAFMIILNFIRSHSLYDVINEYTGMVIWLSLMLYPLLVVCLWWRIRRMRRSR